MNKSYKKYIINAKQQYTYFMFYSIFTELKAIIR